MFKQIGIVGMGFVGSNLARWFKEQKVNVKGYDIDPDKTECGFTYIQSCDLVFLCLPTPYINGGVGYGLSAITDTLSMLTSGVVIIKSTVLPGTTTDLQKEFPNLDLGFVPEFLTERYAWEDTLHPDTSIFGYTPQTHKYAGDILSLLPEASFERIMPAAEAEMVKIARNNYFVNKIVFMNALYDTCEANGIDYEIVKDSLSSDRRIRRSHMEIFHQGGRGGGGTCFTKDAPAFRDYVRDTTGGDAARFVNEYCRVNTELLSNSKKDTGRQYV